MFRFQPQNYEDEEDDNLQNDNGFEEDMEALRQACILTGGNLSPSTSALAESGGADEDFTGSEDEDDFELLRSVQNRFALPTGSSSLNPLSVLPLVSDDEGDDFETLCAVKCRFAAYDEDNHRLDGVKNEMEKLAMETSDDSSVEKSAVGEVLPVIEHYDTADVLIGDNVEMGHSGSIENNELDNCKLSPLELNHLSFPKSAQVCFDAIKRNRSCQKFIRNKLIQIEARIEENKRLRERMKILKDFQSTCRKITGRALALRKDPRIQLISARRTSNSNDPKVNDKKISPLYDGPLENSHVANYRMAMTNFPLSLNRKKWTKAEKENLGKGIRQQFQEMVLQFSMDQLSSEGSPGDANNLDNIPAAVKDLEITQEKMREFLPKVNWDQLASSYVAGRSGVECEARWLNFEDPLINHNPWTTKEDKNLLFIVQEKGVTNWFDIAVLLGTNRTPFQCLSRFQRSLNARILKGEWTKEEDAQLRTAVETYGESDWQSVASALEGRTGTQCSNRWRKTLHPGRQRVGRWTLDEDKRLKVAVKFFGPKKWEKIAQFVPGRTQVQCRERWVNCLDPNLNWGEWTKEEDSRLTAAVEECGYCWSKVAERLPQRTDNQCLRRWRVLVPHEVPLLQAARRVQKAAIMSNFVDRESERPALGPKDFVPLAITGPETEPEKMDKPRKRVRKSRGLESQKEKDAVFGKPVKKLRSKRCRKKMQTSSKEVLGIPENAHAPNFGGSLSAVTETMTEGCSEKLSHTEPVQDHPSPDSISMPLMAVSGEGVDSGQNQLLPKAHSKGHKPVDVDGNSKSLLLLPAENLESSLTNGDGNICRKAFHLNKSASIKKRKAHKQHSRERTCAPSGDGSSVLSETTDAEALINGYPDSNLLARINGEDIVVGQLVDSSKKRVLHPKSSELTASLDCLSSPPESSELRVTRTENICNSSLARTTREKSKASKLPCRRKKRIEPSREDRCVASVPVQHDYGEKSKPRYKSCSKKVLELVDEDNTTLASFLANKSKKRRLEVAQNTDQACSSSRMIMGPEVPSGVDQTNKRKKKMPSQSREGEGQTCSNGRSSENGLSCEMDAHHSKHMLSEHCGSDLSNRGEGVDELVSLNQEAPVEPDDVTLVSFLSKKQKTRAVNTR